MKWQVFFVVTKLVCVFLFLTGAARIHSAGGGEMGIALGCAFVFSLLAAADALVLGSMIEQRQRRSDQ